MWKQGDAVTITTSMCSNSHFYTRKKAGKKGRVGPEEAREVMGINTPMTAFQIGEAVPPKYAEFVARSAIEAMNRT